MFAFYLLPTIELWVNSKSSTCAHEMAEPLNFTMWEASCSKRLLFCCFAFVCVCVCVRPGACAQRPYDCLRLLKWSYRSQHSSPMTGVWGWWGEDGGGSAGVVYPERDHHKAA